MLEPSQIPLDFGHQPAFSEADFLVAGSNAEAHGWILRWPAWPAPALGLWGPAGCGKSHLAHVFAARSGGVVVAACEFGFDDVPILAEHPSVVVEDADRGVDEAAMFHLYNLLRETGRSLLVTGREAPARWGLRLPDLRSRLSSIPAVGILAPDDGLLQALLLKLFADRQLRIGPDVLAYVLLRMERSFDAARALVAAIDAAALARQRPVTVPLVRDVMADPASDSDF
jgi:chromosomal replication initiation ATPase DnaA